MKQTLALIEIRFKSHFTSGEVKNWSGWHSLYAFESLEDANNEARRLKDEEMKLFKSWIAETKHDGMFMLHDYRVVDLYVY